ncbi:hypothetical protein [Mycobacterium simiae]|uniref:Uncharacterized protein n=1 Tax=Mycobacterium simiae TaxID=1784 RepID=A0A1X0YF49_MYCSI|nr:hypothetical protein [Mycobacterium simiae]ORJ63841.1 hypothetical protein B5M45_04700 [Mycobacterium simiae]
MSGDPLRLEDLAYELRLLLGADALVACIEADARFGNLVNYFKDSAYLHARNLLNALTEHADTEVGPIPGSIRSAVYRNRIKKPLERYVMHLESARDQIGVSNIFSDGRELNQHVPDLATEVRRCWSEWIAATGDQRLQEILDSSEESARDDVSQLKGLMS